MKKEILELIETKNLTEAQVCEGFIEILENNKSFLSKCDRIMHLCDAVLYDGIFDSE